MVSEQVMKIKLKKILGQIHLWLGLITGIIIVIVCLTGAIWAFSPEIEELTQDYRKVEFQNKAIKSTSELRKVAQKNLPKYRVRRVSFLEKGKAVTADFWGEDYRYTMFIDPYSGRVLKIKNEKQDFFYWVIVGHYTLWMGEFGSQIVKWATLFFVILLITGIVLWWPKNKAAAKQRFWFRWKPNLKWKRKNYDLHNILGFYGSWVVVFAAFTGVLWMFESINEPFLKLISGGEKIEETEVLSMRNKAASSDRIDSLVQKTRFSYSNQISEMSIRFPETDSSAIEISIYPEKGTYHNGDYLYFDQYTYKNIPVKSWGKYTEASNAEKLWRQYYDIHIGSVFGLTGRIAMFLATLIAGSLPVTGFYIWWGRRKKVNVISNHKFNQ
jgi:uncharacterized iron-regulated membrane protein